MHGAHGTRGGAASARVELCKDSGDKCHAQLAARRSHPPRDCPGQSPACAGGSLTAFSRFSERCQSGCEAKRQRELLFLELRLPRRHPRRFPATSGTRTISSQPGPRSRRDAPEAAAGTAGLDLTAPHSWKEPS